MQQVHVWRSLQFRHSINKKNFPRIFTHVFARLQTSSEWASSALATNKTQKISSKAIVHLIQRELCSEVVYGVEVMWIITNIIHPLSTLISRVHHTAGWVCVGEDTARAVRTERKGSGEVPKGWRELLRRGRPEAKHQRVAHERTIRVVCGQTCEDPVSLLYGW